MGILKNILSGSAKATVDAVADAVDRFVSTPEEKEEIRAAIEKEISSRWSSDLSSDSWLSKNVRPLTLATVVVFLVLMTFFEGVGISSVSERWIGLWELVSVTVIGGYFAVRTVDKRGKIK
jgi:hypothetical protein|tara:strand:- start:2069 stop:2431 length:363 start_codon:yes stop_codon:yes gene_type:complete